MYSNVDVFLNKKNEFLAKIEEKQPKIIALTEILPKNNEEVNEAEFDISGYNTFLNKSLKDVVTPYTHISEASRYILYTIILTIDGICTLS